LTDLLTSTSSGLAALTLNRPEALHALDTHMCRNMIQALTAYRDDAEVKAILIDHAPARGGSLPGALDHGLTDRSLID
jgi:enoyl-CoA hydratase